MIKVCYLFNKSFSFDNTLMDRNICIKNYISIGSLLKTLMVNTANVIFYDLSHVISTIDMKFDEATVCSVVKII